MNYREIKENELKFDSYVEDRFVLMGKRMISEYEKNMNSKSPKCWRQVCINGKKND